MPSVVTKELRVKNTNISRNYFKDNNVYCFIARDFTWRHLKETKCQNSQITTSSSFQRM